MRGPPVIVIIERLCALEKKATTWLLSATTRIEVCKCVQTVHIEKRPKNYALVLRSMTIKCIMFKKIMRFCHKPRYAPKNITIIIKNVLFSFKYRTRANKGRSWIVAAPWKMSKIGLFWWTLCNFIYQI